MLTGLALALRIAVAGPAAATPQAPVTPLVDPASFAAATAATAIEAHELELNVTATGIAGPAGALPSAVTVVQGAELDHAPALTLDGVLRAVPGFTLFRRSGSRTANPTAQGATLRGLGGSATSRALVLADGVPLIDPFGGWAHWNRVPAVALERVEVVRGGASGLYGTGALAGVVQLFRRTPAAELDAIVEAQVGQQDTASGASWISGRRRAWSAAVAVERFTSRGYVAVADDERGPVDRPAGSRHSLLDATVAHERPSSRLVLRANRFRERRGNGTALQGNGTDLGELTLRTELTTGARILELQGWALSEDYEQDFTAVEAGRASERLIREQRIPSEAHGGSARWTSTRSPDHTLLAGVDGRRVRGESRERAHLAGGAVRDLAAGGTQRSFGVWIEDLVQLAPRWSAAAALRYDSWRNEASTDGASARASALSPRLALRFQPTSRLGVALAGYGAFRSPTLNELYRGFRVGEVTTDPNPELGPERLRGGEIGVDWASAGERRLRLQGTAFWMELEDTITNVTVASGPDGILRRRENVGRNRSRGTELEASVRLRGGLDLRLAGQYADAEVVEFAADPSLLGRRPAQVPREQVALGVDWRRAAYLATAQLRWTGDAFDDDRNELPLGEQRVVDLRLGRDFGPVALFVAAENVLDEEHVVGRTPTRTVGSPRLFRAGLRWRRDSSP